MDNINQDFSGKSVLITGGLGFIGSNLAITCHEAGAKVTIFDCLDPHSGGKQYNIHGIDDKVEMCHHDILNFDRIAQHIVGKDIVINCAASTSHPYSMREPWFDLDVNSRGVINLLEGLRRFNRKAKFIQLGTSTQLGPLQFCPADENHPEFPTDIYSANKSAAEKYVLIYAKAHQLRATVLRLSNVFGPRSSVHSPEFTFNNFFIGQALQGKEITVFGKGLQKRNVIFVDDAVSAILLAAQSEEANGETLFAVGDNHYSVAEIAEATVKYFENGSVKFIDWPEDRKLIEVGDAIISNEKIKKLLAWRPADDLHSGLIKTKKYYDEASLEECFKGA